MPTTTWAECCQQVEESGLSSQLSTGEVASGVLYPVWVPQYMRNRNILEQVQQSATKIIKGLKHLPYKDKLWKLGLVSLEKSKAQGDLIYVPTYLKGGCKEDGARLFPVVPSNRTRANGDTLKHRKFCLSITIFFSCRVDQRGFGVSVPADV